MRRNTIQASAASFQVRDRRVPRNINRGVGDSILLNVEMLHSVLKPASEGTASGERRRELGLPSIHMDDHGTQAAGQP
jgi:hypothetical protein